MARPKTRKPNPKLVVGYARVSTGRQAAEGISLEHQQDAVEAYCRIHGLTMTHMLVDGGSSAYKQPLARRTEGASVVAMVEQRRVGAVVALRLDRLFRSIKDAIDNVMAWDKAGVALHLLDMGGASVDTSTPMGRMMIALLAGFAELESYHKAERARDAWEYKRARGQRLGSKPPYGYRMDNECRPVPHRTEQRSIQFIVEKRAEGLSIAKICAALFEEGHEPRGAKWHLTTVDRILERAATEQRIR